MVQNNSQTRARILLAPTLFINFLERIMSAAHEEYDGRVKPPPPPSPSNFIAGRPKAALLFWFFGGFRCGVPLFIVILVIY